VEDAMVAMEAVSSELPVSNSTSRVPPDRVTVSEKVSEILTPSAGIR